MNLKLFQAARERLAKATPGPWVDEYLHEVSVEDEDQQDVFLQIALIDTHQNMSCDMAEANTKFIAHAPADLEAALAVIDVLVEALTYYSKGCLTPNPMIQGDPDDPHVMSRTITDRQAEVARKALARARKLGGENEAE